jgi:transcription elongation factor Elf1
VSFYKNIELIEHLQQVHKIQEKLLFCDECSYYIDTQERLDSHKYYVHPTEKRVYPCIYEYCDFVGQHPSRTKRHVMTRHSLERPFECNYCEATFKINETLKQHEAIHRNELIYHCDICEYKTITQSRLTSHKYWHNPNYIYKCHLCDTTTTYNKKSTLLEHIENIHGKDALIGIKKQKEYQTYLFLTKKGLTLKPYTVNLYTYFQESCLYVDYHFEYDGILYLLEVDEDMHSRYGIECDSNRMHKILNYMFLIDEKRPIIFLRYNPDKFYLNGIKHTKETYDRNTRMEELYEFVVNYKSTNPYAVKYFFYDSEDDTTIITEHPEYNQYIKQYVL